MEWSTIAILINMALLVIGNIAYISYQGGYIKRRLDAHESDIAENGKDIKNMKESFTRPNGTTTYVSRKEFDKLEQEMHNRLRRLEEANQRSNRKILDALHSLEKQIAIINQHITDSKGTSPLTKNAVKFFDDDDDGNENNESDYDL